MHIDCKRCGRQLEYSGDCPRFCSYCGNALDETAEAVTVPPSRVGAAGTAAVDVTEGQSTREEWWPPAPDTVAGYHLVRVLGKGGMGCVYEAEHLASGRRVALKLISPQVAASASSVERFRQEGRLASTVAHPRCVFVLAADTDAGRPFIVMELMPGSTLQDLLDQRGPLPPAEAVAKILDVIDGLIEAHRRGVIHRDIKPSNCFIEADGRVKIGDFGLSRSLTGAVHLTKTGTFLGTPLYASPEQVRGDRLDQQTDIYSLAATLYALIAGKAPFQTGDAAATLARIVADSAPPLRSVRPEVSPALDRVILRGLERDRSKRWRDLEQFRDALLPFAPGRLSIGGMGIRVGAYFLDYTLLYIVQLPWTVYMLTDMELILREGGGTSMFVAQAASIGIFLVYYAVLEGLWGATFGKWLLRLRVRRTNGVDLPGLARSIPRAVIFQGSFSIGLIVANVWWYLAVVGNVAPEHLALWFNVFNAMTLIGMVLGLAALLAPMRERNGYRGLHEVLTGTRVVALPPPPPARWTASAGLEPAVVARTGIPASLGSFTVHGVLYDLDEGVLLRGDDPGLERTVWLWLRDRAAPALSVTRRELGRATRLRWLASGVDDGRQWDAFLAPAGCPLANIIEHTGAQDWHFVHRWLEQLAEELKLACADETLPMALTASHAWIRPDGGLMLLDFPAGAGEAVVATEIAPSLEDEALALFTTIAVCSLEGTPPTDHDAPRVRARLPLYAADLLDLLVAGETPPGGLKYVHRELVAMKARPATVSRWRRVGQLGIWLGFLALGPLWCLCGLTMFPTFALLEPTFHLLYSGSALENLEQGAARELAVGLLQPQPFVRLQAVAQYQEDMALAQRLRAAIGAEQEDLAQRTAAANPVTRGWIETTMRTQADQIKRDALRRRGETVDPRTIRFFAALEADRSNRGDHVVGMITGIAISASIWLAVAALWAFAWRGGVSFWLAGIALVRGDGRLAPRWRCAWRALLFWLPVLTLIIAAPAVDLIYLDSLRDPTMAWLWWPATLLWWAFPALGVAYFLLAIRNSTRSVHDRLAGTYLVPR